MGAEPFYTFIPKSPEVDTVEKDSFVVIPRSEMGEMLPDEYGDHLITRDDPRVTDKWGPAGCIEVDDQGLVGWHFFGVSPS